MPRYRVKPGQSHWMRSPDKLRRGMIKFGPGDELELNESTAKAFADKFEYVGDSQAEAAEKQQLAENAEEAEPGLQHIGGGWYNIINKDTGQPINEKPLRLETARNVLEAAQKAAEGATEVEPETEEATE